MLTIKNSTGIKDEAPRFPEGLLNRWRDFLRASRFVATSFARIPSFVNIPGSCQSRSQVFDLFGVDAQETEIVASAWTSAVTPQFWVSDCGKRVLCEIPKDGLEAWFQCLGVEHPKLVPDNAAAIMTRGLVDLPLLEDMLVLHRTVIRQLLPGT